MRLYTVILIFFLCHGINHSLCQIDKRLHDDESSGKEIKTGLVSLLDTLSIYRTAFSFRQSENALETCCQDVTTPGLDLLFVLGRYFHGLIKLLTVTIIDRFHDGYDAIPAHSFRSQPIDGDPLTHHGTYLSPPPIPSSEKPVSEKTIKEFSKFAKLEATPRRVICKCGKPRGCEQKPPKPFDDSKPIIKALAKTLPKELPSPLLWVILGILAGFIVTVICQITQRAVNHVVQKETAKDTARYILLALKELDLYTAPTSRQRQRQRNLQQRARRALASRHLRPRSSHTMMDCNNLLETRNPENICVQSRLDESTVHAEGEIKDTSDLSLGNTEEDKKMEAEETASPRNSEHSSRYRQGSPDFCDPRMRREDAAKQDDGMEGRLDSSPSLWCLPNSQMPVVDPVWPSGSPWMDSDDYSNAHSVHKLALPSESKGSLCSSLGDEMKGPWVSTSLSFIVYDLDIIEDIPDEVLEVLSCDDRPCALHPHERYHYLGRKVIVQRLPLPDDSTSSTFIPSVDLKVSPLASVSVQEPATFLQHEHKAANLDTLTSKKLMSDESPSHLLSIDEITFNTDEVRYSDQDLDEADNFLRSSEPFNSTKEFENELSTQNVTLENEETSFFNFLDPDAVSSRLQEGSKTAKEFLTKFENIGSMMTALTEVINFCKGIKEQQKAEESLAQKEVPSDDLRSHENDQKIHKKPLTSIPLKSLDRSFSLEKVSAVKEGLDELSPGIKASTTVVPNKKLYSLQEKSVGVEPTSNVFLGRTKPKLCIPAAKAASADFIGDQMKPAITSSAKTPQVIDDSPRRLRSESKPFDRDALFKDLKEKVAAKGLGRSENEIQESVRNTGTDPPEWEDSDLSLNGERGQNLRTNQSDSTSTFCDFRSSLERAMKWKLPPPPSSSKLHSARQKRDTSGQSQLRTTETDLNDDKDHNIVIVPFGFSVKQKTPEPPSSRGVSPLQSSKDSEENLHRSQESFRSDSLRSLYKVSSREASPTWEVSERGRNSVFSPVGWSNKRSEVSSLFREQNGEKLHESSSQTQTMTSSPKSHTNAESPRVADTRMNSSPFRSVVENSKEDEHRTMFHAIFDNNPRKRRAAKQNADSFTSSKGKSIKASIGDHHLTSPREKHPSEAIEIPVLYKGTTSGDRSPRSHSAGVRRNDPTDSLHQPYVINTETPDRSEKNFRSNWKLSSSRDQPKSKTLITGKPPLPRDIRASSLYGSRHAHQNSFLTKATSNKSSPVSPRPMSEEESDHDEVAGKDINEELKRRIRGMVKTGKIIQGLIRKKNTGDLNDTSSQQKEEPNTPLPKPRASITVYLEGKKRSGSTSASAHQDKVSCSSNVDNSFSATKTRSDKSQDAPIVYPDLYPMANQDRSDSSQASSGYASVLDREGPVIDILMPVSAGSLCSSGMEKFLKPEAIAVSPADGSDAGDSLSQTNVARPKLSKIPIFSNHHEDNRVQRKAKRKSYDAKEDNKNSDNIEKESPSVVLGTHIFKSGSEQRPGNSEYTSSVKTGLLGQARRNANSVVSESTRWVDSKPQESKDTRRKPPVIGDKKALLTSPRKIPKGSRMKRVSPLIAQKIGLLERTVTENETKASEERREIGKLYECLDTGNSTTNAWAGDVTSISDKEVTNLRILDKTRRNRQRIRLGANKRVSCLPRLIKDVNSLPKEENFSQNHIACISSNLTMPSPQDQLLCGSFDSGELVDSCTASLQDSFAESAENMLTKGHPQSKYLPECEERSHLIVDIINGTASLKDIMSSPITNHETAELKAKSRVLASTLQKLQQELIQRVKKIISKESEKNGDCERTVRRWKSDSDLGFSFPVSSLVQMNKHSKGLFKEKDSSRCEETKGCDWPTMSTSLPLEENAFSDVDESFLSQDCSIPDNADSPEMVSIVGFPQANSTVDEDDEDTVTSHGNNCILNGDFEDVRTSMTTPTEGCHLNLSRRHTAHLTGSFDMSDKDGQPEGAHQDVRCGQRSSSVCGPYCDVDNPLDEFMWNVDLPIAGSRDVMAVLPKMAVDLVMWSKDRSDDNEQLTTTVLEESFDDLILHNVIHESRDLRIYGHSSFLELGMAWLLQKTFSKISAKGDNFGIMNISTFDTRIKAIGRNASF